jgi:hypothetical protein
MIFYRGFESLYASKNLRTQKDKMSTLLSGFIVFIFIKYRCRSTNTEAIKIIQIQKTQLSIKNIQLNVLKKDHYITEFQLKKIGFS